MNKVMRVMAISFIVNSLLSILKIVAGFIGRSSALITDGIHSFSDLTTDVVAIIGLGLSKKKPDKEHPYGHGKTEYLTSFIVGVIIIFLGVGIIQQMTYREVTKPNILIVAVILFTIISKYVLAAYVLRKGMKHRNNVLIASAKESKGDVFSSVIVLVSTISAQFMEQFPPLVYADKVASIIIGVYIIRVGFDVIKVNYSHILGEQVTDEEYIKGIDKVILSYSEVKKISDLKILKYGYAYSLVSVIKMENTLTLSKAHRIVDKIEKDIKKYDLHIKHITVHMEPYFETKKNK